MSNDTNNVTVSGLMIEQATASQTDSGCPKARFVIRSSRTLVIQGAEHVVSDDIAIIAFAHGANSVLKYGSAGVEVLVSGHLSTYAGPEPRMFVATDCVGFPSVSQCRHE